MMVRQRNNLYINSIAKDLDHELYDLLLYQANSILYNYGDHHKANSPDLTAKIKTVGKRLFQDLYRFKFLYPYSSGRGRKCVLSNAYVDLGLEQAEVFLPPWSSSFNNKILSNWALANTIRAIYFHLSKRSIKDLFSSDFLTLVRQYETQFSQLLTENEVTCLIVPNDLSFFENLSLKTARKRGIATMVYLHGLPGRYNPIDDNRADYLVVWGKGIKEQYMKQGVEPSKILALKHPVYSNFEEISLRSGLKEVLVISKALPGTPSSSDKLKVADRAECLFYLDQLKKILQQMRVSKAKLRIHPSESESFYLDNLCDDFYFIDKDDKLTSLKKSSLVIGPTSTMLLDSIKSGVNYILYAPDRSEEIGGSNEELVSPFDGRSFIQLSRNLKDIERNVKNPDENINKKLLAEYFETSSADHAAFSRIIGA